MNLVAERSSDLDQWTVEGFQITEEGDELVARLVLDVADKVFLRLRGAPNALQQAE